MTEEELKRAALEFHEGRGYIDRIGNTPEMHLAQMMVDFAAPLIAEARAEGARSMRERAAEMCEGYKRDASFDDSQVGAAEHLANQWNIANAIRALPDFPEGERG